MNYQELVKRLGEKETKVRYWRSILIKHQLIAPKKGIGPHMTYSSEDLAQFTRLQASIKAGNCSASEAMMLMQGNIGPLEAIERYEKASREIAILQKKVLQLRKGKWLNKLVDWFKVKFSFLRRGERQEGTL